MITATSSRFDHENNIDALTRVKLQGMNLSFHPADPNSINTDPLIDFIVVSCDRDNFIDKNVQRIMFAEVIGFNPYAERSPKILVDRIRNDPVLHHIEETHIRVAPDTSVILHTTLPIVAIRRDLNRLHLLMIVALAQQRKSLNKDI
jgi:hypothetical protein